YTFSVRQTDTAGNTGPFATSSYVLDTTAGLPTITSSPPSPGNDTTPTWAFTGEAGATFGCQLVRGATVISALSSCTSPRTYDLSADVDGTYTFSVRETDILGNTSGFVISDYLLDTTAPAAPTITEPPPSPGRDPPPAW